MKDPSTQQRVPFNLQVVLMGVVVSAVLLTWWRTSSKLSQTQAQLDAMRQAQELAAEGPHFHEASMPRQLPANKCNSPEEFITALRTISDWYEFADDTADLFVKTPIADNTIPLLIGLLDDADAEIRRRALSTLGKINRHPDMIVPAVIPLLNDEHANVRWHAAFALGAFNDRATMAVPTLIEQMNDDQSPVAAFSAMCCTKLTKAFLPRRG